MTTLMEQSLSRWWGPTTFINAERMWKLANIQFLEEKYSIVFSGSQDSRKWKMEAVVLENRIAGMFGAKSTSLYFSCPRLKNLHLFSKKMINNSRLRGWTRISLSVLEKEDTVMWYPLLRGLIKPEVRRDNWPRGPHLLISGYCRSEAGPYSSSTLQRQESMESMESTTSFSTCQLGCVPPSRSDFRIFPLQHGKCQIYFAVFKDNATY